MAKTKYIKFKKNKLPVITLQNWIINKDVTNAQLVSLELHRACKKFISEVEQIPLSIELQPWHKKMIKAKKKLL